MVILSKKEQRRLVVLNQVEVGKNGWQGSIWVAGPLLTPYSGNKRMLRGIFSCYVKLWLAMVYLWRYTMTVMAYLSVPEGSQSRWKNSLRVGGSQLSLAG